MISIPKFLYYIFAAYTFKCGLVEADFPNVAAFIVAVIVAGIAIILKPILLMIATQSYSDKTIIFLVFTDLIIIIPAIWGACQAWDWNILVAIAVFCIGSILIPF